MYIEIEALARKNGVTFTGCGIWDMSRIWSGILTAGPCTDISSIHISSLTDPQGQANSLAQIKQYCISDTVEPVVYDVPVKTNYVPEGYFEAGLVMGVRFHCETTTEEGVVGTGLVDQRMFLPGDVEHMYWEVEGKPRNRTRVERLDSAHATAGNLFNRIP